MDTASFGDRLQELRRRAKLSQEALAQRLGVSPQSVSKWETGRNLPETALILPLSRLLGVRAGELLGEREDLRKQWEARWQEALRDGGHGEALTVAEAALRELPEDRLFRFRQANGEYQAAALTEEASERLRLLSASERHLSALLRDFPAFEEAGTMLVQVLVALNRRREAEALAERLPNREKLQLILRRGEERAEALRRVITRSVFELLNLLLSEGSPAALEMTGAILEAAGQDRQLTFYRMDLHRQRAAQLSEKGDKAGALEALEALLSCALEEAAEVRGEPFLLPTLEEDSEEVRRRWVLEALEGECFASLRGEAAFQALRERAWALRS